MSKKRKTIPIAAIKEKANQYLRLSANEKREGRQMLATFVSALLMEANAYAGFGYLYESHVPPGHTFGIIFDESECHAHQYPDDSRIAYH